MNDIMFSTPEEFVVQAAVQVSFDPTWWILAWNTAPMRGTMGQLVEMARQYVASVNEAPALGLVGLVGLWWKARKG